MDVKSYIGQVKVLESDLKRYEERLEEIRSRAEGLEYQIKERVRSSQAKDILGDAVAELVDLEREYATQISEFMQLRFKIFADINQLSKDEHKAILIGRYIDYKQWEDIAEELGYTTRHITRLHNDALKQLKAVLLCPM